MTIDSSDLRRFEFDLRRATASVRMGIPAVVSRGALNIKNQLAEEMRSSRHFKGAAGSISYDLLDAGTAADIGPDKDRRGGALGNIAYFGTSRGGGTVPDPQGALDAEVPNFETALGRLGEAGL